MIGEPSPTGDNGRDNRGRFGPGNKAGKGNPLNKRTQQIRVALILAVKPSDVRKAVKKLIEQAVAGDRLALAELLDRTIGRPAMSDIETRIAQLEQLMAERNSRE
jgi:hypothetical protein